jgi:hypothetical protein
MTRLHRAILFYTFLIVFLIAAPLLVLYTAGYRYSLQSGRIARVGILALKSVPRDATITLNEIQQSEHTPALLKLSPDEYQVLVTQSGFHSWKKLLPVRSQATTFAEDIILWRATEPEIRADIAPLVTTPLSRFSISYDLLRGLTLFDAANTTLTPITDLAIDATPPTATIAPDGSTALVTYINGSGRTQFIAIRIPEAELIDTNFLTNFQFEKLMWGETAGTLYGVTNNQLRSVNLFTRRVDTIAQTGSPFTIRGTTVWSVSDEARVLLTKSQAGKPQEAPKPIAELPEGRYAILPTPHPYLLLHEQNNNQLLLLDLGNPTEILLELPGAEVATRTNGAGELELLAWNNFELWRANVSTKTTELLRRQSEAITSAAWYPRGEYVALSFGDQVEMIELDTRYGRMITRLAQFPDHQVTNLIPDPRGAFLLLTVTGGPDAGLYSLELQ